MGLTQPIKYHGGKHYLAKEIIALMPEHTHYVEPYFGGGSVLLQKPYQGVSEVVNDIDGELMNLWSVLRQPLAFKAFLRAVEATPFSEQLFETATTRFVIWPEDMPNVDAAWAFFVRARQSRQGLMQDFATLSRNRTRRGMNEQVSSWLTAIEGLPEVHDRLKRVVIFNKEAISVIRQQDGPNTLFYCDPPYMKITRSAKAAYRNEMDDEHHGFLLRELSRINGKFILSGYNNKLYDDAMKEHGWNCKYIMIDNKASSAKSKATKVECLWYNFEEKS